MKKLLMILGSISIVVFFSCEKNPSSPKSQPLPKSHGTYHIDVSGVNAKSAGGTPKLFRKAVGQASPFCSLNKFEINIVYIQVSLINDSIGGITQTVLDTPNADGVKINLVSEKLSDKIALSISDSLGGPKVFSASIGIDKHITVNGTLDSLGTILRSSPAGFLHDGGMPEDYVLDITNAGWWEMDSNQTAATEVKSIAIMLGDSSLVEFADSGTTLDIKIPLDIAITFRGPDAPRRAWTVASSYWAAPYIEGQMTLEKYYLRREGDSIWTDVVKILLDKAGNPIPGQVAAGPFLATPRSVLAYDASLGYNNPGALYDPYSAVLGGDSLRLVLTSSGYNSNYYIFNSFQRKSHIGTMRYIYNTIDRMINYECLKVE